MLEAIADTLGLIADFMISSEVVKKRRISKIDAILSSWAKRTNTSIQTNYKDENVRSFSLVDDAGNSYQIWVNILSRKRLEINISNNKTGNEKKYWRKKTSISRLNEVLYLAYAKIEKWIEQSGNRRTQF